MIDTRKRKKESEEHEANEPPIALIKIKVVRQDQADATMTMQAPYKVQQALTAMGFDSQLRVEMQNSAGMSLGREEVMQAGDYTLEVEPWGAPSRNDDLENSMQARIEEMWEEIRRIQSQLEQSQTNFQGGFSQVSQSMVDRMLTSLGFDEVSGWAVYDCTEQLAGLAEVEAFDYSRFADENAATPELMQYHQENLEQHGIEFGRNAFGMRDLRSHKTALAISSSDFGLDLRGGVDAAVIPFGCLAYSAVRKTRIGFVHKQSAQAKQNFLSGDKASGSSQASQSTQGTQAGCLQYSDNRPQAICTLLAAHCATQLPLDIDLTDGKVHHILRLRGSEVLTFRDLTPAKAYYLMAMQLKEHKELKQSRARLSAPPPELDEAQRKPFQLLQTLVPEDTTAQQMKDLMSFAPTFEEKMQIAAEFIQDHTRRGGELGLPDGITDFYA